MRAGRFQVFPRLSTTVNDPDMSELVREVASEVVAPESIRAAIAMGAEIRYYLERYGRVLLCRQQERGTRAGLGTHHPKFDIDEQVMAWGMETCSNRVSVFGKVDAFDFWMQTRWLRAAQG